MQEKYLNFFLVGPKMQGAKKNNSVAVKTPPEILEGCEQWRSSGLENRAIGNDKGSIP